MHNRWVRMTALGLLLVSTLGLRCGGNRHLWFRINCAVAREGSAEPGVLVSFMAIKVKQDRKLDWSKVVDEEATTLETGWTTPFVCDFDLYYDDRSTMFIEDVRVIATVDDEGTIYADTVFYTPEIWMNDTQPIGLRVDLPRYK